MKPSFKNLLPGKKVLVVLSIIGIVCLLQLTFGAMLQPAEAAPVPVNFWLLRFFGRLHPLLVHFPLGLLLVAAVLELATLKNFSSPMRPGIIVLVIAGVIAAIFSAVFGLLLAREGDYGKDLLSLHQWAGIATVFAGAVTWFLMNRALKGQHKSRIVFYRTMLFFSAAGLSVAGHFGASLTHGKDYLSATMPWSKDYTGPQSDNFDLAAIKNDTARLTKQQETELNVAVRAVLAHNCYKCHGADKIKGDLRLDRKDMVFKGGESGEIIVPGNPAESELYRRITLPPDHKDAMPSKGKTLPAADIAVIKLWIEKGAPWTADGEKSLFRVAALAPRNPALPAAPAGLSNPVDKFTNQYFATNKIGWPALVDDRLFLRRVYLDIIGLLPTPAAADSFAKDTRPDKRSLWIRQLLNRQDDYATHWLSFWNDALRNDYTGTGYITQGRFNITDWLYKSIRADKPYDQFVKELISPTEASKGFISGIQWRGVVNASQRTEMQAAQNVSQVFLGLNLKCASCHNSFISDWKLTDAYGFANIFADSSLEVNRCDKPTGKFTVAKMLWKELGDIDGNAKKSERLARLAENITRPENGRLYRTIVNRLWAQLMGRGLVEPVDAMDNEPWNQDLLDWMAFNFQQQNCDIKELIYLITTSNTYQLKSVGFKEPATIIAKDYQFTGTLRKRMSAEQFSDAAGYIIAPLFYDSMVMYKPSGNKKDHPFPRASLVVNNSFLTALGRPNRETVSTGRESQANLLQALELTNGERFNKMIAKGAKAWQEKYKTSDVIIKEFYRQALGREVQSKEYQIAVKILGNQPGTEAIEDLFWSVLLLPEFQIIY